MNNQYMWIAIIGVLGIVGGTLFIFFNKNKKNSSIPPGLPTEYVDELSLATVIEHFKQPALMSRLKANSSFVACAIKEKDGTKWKVLLTIFDTDKDDVVMDDCKIYITDMLAPDLSRQFGDKEMMVLK